MPTPMTGNGLGLELDGGCQFAGGSSTAGKQLKIQMHPPEHMGRAVWVKMCLDLCGCVHLTLLNVVIGLLVVEMWVIESLSEESWDLEHHVSSDERKLHNFMSLRVATKIPTSKPIHGLPA